MVETTNWLITGAKLAFSQQQFNPKRFLISYFYQKISKKG